MGTIAGAHGPPIALVYQRETPSRIRAALLPFFALANPISLIGLAAVGMFAWREIYASALLLPGLVAGYLAAPLLMRLLSPAAVRVAILLISAASGVALMVIIVQSGQRSSASPSRSRLSGRTKAAPFIRHHNSRRVAASTFGDFG